MAHESLFVQINTGNLYSDVLRNLNFLGATCIQNQMRIHAVRYISFPFQIAFNLHTCDSSLLLLITRHIVPIRIFRDIFVCPTT